MSNQSSQFATEVEDEAPQTGQIVSDNMLATVANEGETYSSQYPEVKITAKGLILPPNFSLEAWSGLGRKLLTAQEKIQWVVGDWYNFGIDRWGEDAYHLLDGYQYSTMRNLGFVARRFVDPARVSPRGDNDEIVRSEVGEKALRRDTLTWSHHREVAALDEEDRITLLDRAEAENLTVRELKQEAYHLRSVKGMVDPPYDVQTADEFIEEWGDRAFADGVNTVELTIHRLCDPTYAGSTRILGIITARHKAALKTDSQAEDGK